MLIELCDVELWHETIVALVKAGLLFKATVRAGARDPYIIELTGGY